MSQLSSAPVTCPLRGTVTVPGDKSITHRALILGALAQGQTHITGYSQGEDCLNTLSVVRELGIDVREIPEGLEVNGKGLWGPHGALECAGLWKFGNRLAAVGWSVGRAGVLFCSDR